MRFIKFLLCLCLLFFAVGNGIGKELGKGMSRLVIIPSWPVKSLDPSKGGYPLLRYNIAETLVGVDKEGRLKSSLATSWSVHQDKITWEFKLRKRVKFHDNSPMDAFNVAKYLRFIFHKTGLDKLVPIKEIKASDKYTLLIVTEKPFAPLPAYLACAKTAILSTNSFDSKNNFTSPIATGPFKVVKFTSMREVLLDRFSSYWGNQAKVDKVVLKSIPDPRSRVPMILSGEVDIAQLIPPQSVLELTKFSNIKIVKYPITRVRMLQLNCLKNIFRDKRIRRALQYAINREAIDKEILDGAGMSAGALFPPLLVWSAKIKPYSYNIHQAKVLLEKAGWKDIDGDGILENTKTKEKFIIKLVTYPERAELPLIAEVLQDQFRKIGVKVELEVVKVAAIKSIRKKGDFDIILLSRGLFFIPDPDFIMMQDYYSGRKKWGWGAYGWKSQEVDCLLEQARTDFNFKNRLNMYRKVQNIIYNESPVIFIDYYVNIDAIRSNISDYNGHITEFSYELNRIKK
ncbi:peptide/nickel transport system substrate-binding protein [Desulfonauticus submarinus]|uniref:Peptide/nickel transport system substrate-binding protein n=1 Tax=Desulfonauticus submarinus TaxID=206665 RepID=A0A1H0BDB7_9BACT|nr:ABC transporter substrate-binding protein [Desulfonauticus submarinus]SDN43672.1 peptide/nickel transport system substrate-binding protein [Desulfonauticus submarinus]